MLKKSLTLSELKSLVVELDDVVELLDDAPLAAEVGVVAVGTVLMRFPFADVPRALHRFHGAGDPRFKNAPLASNKQQSKFATGPHDVQTKTFN